MYLLDPDRGPRRRSLLRDQGGHVGHKDSLVGTAGRVRGVREVQNELQIHADSAGAPALQGLGRCREPELLQNNWSPTTRVAVGTVGGLLALKGSRTHGIQGQFISALGFGLLARAASNVPARSLVGLATGQSAIEVEKTLLVQAPVEAVWELWSTFENLPRFMAHLRDVRQVDEGRSHWVAVGPAGVPLEWDALITDWVPNQFIGWRSAEGSPVETSGQVRFRAVSDSETQIDVQLTYQPPAGAAGHAVAALLGVDPKRAMDEDLIRLKSLLEDQNTSTPVGSVRLEEVSGGKAGRSRRGSSKPKNKS
jgi:uncharacterized membrane protein